MKTQIFVAGKVPNVIAEINSYLKEGYYVVPESVKLHTCAGGQALETHYCYTVVILEKDKQ